MRMGCFKMSNAPPPPARSSRRLLLIVAHSAVLGFITAQPARAATHETSPCCSTGLDSNNVTLPTAPTSTSCHNVCNDTALGGGSGQFVETCDLTANGGGYGALAVAIYDPTNTKCVVPGSGGSAHLPYCAFGQDASGTAFYCAWDLTDGSSDDLTGVTIQGGGLADTIQLWWNDGTANFDLDAYPSYSGSGFLAQIYGFGGDDELQGSSSTNADYQDHLLGGADDDTICGLSGSDICDGAGGDDLVCGDDDNDVLYSGPAATGAGNVLCGGLGTGNYLYGGPDTDYLDYGFNGVNSCGGGSDYSNNGPADTDCETRYTGKCP